jgi:aminoglycoside phosphotransferase (APT) family kinase protein
MTDVIPADVIPVREEEDFNRERLAAYLRGRLEGSDVALDVLQFGGGHANLTYLLHFGEREYVLRRPPLGPVAPSAHDMSREYRVLSVLHRAYPPAPRALLYCDDPDIIGAPFFVMERRKGVVVRWTIPPEFGGGEDSAVNRRVSEALIDALADLHEVDYAAVGLGDLGRPEGFMRRQVDGWTARYARAKTKDLAVVTDVIQWLVERLPSSPVATLVHNDWRLDNIMLNANDPGRVEAVFDWDMCTVGDPLADLGTLMASWAEAGEDFVGVAGRMPSTVPGFLTRREAVERYGRRRGVDVSQVPYYQVFGLFKLGVVLQQIYYRYHAGQTTDERFQHLDQLAEMLFALAGERMYDRTL